MESKQAKEAFLGIENAVMLADFTDGEILTLVDLEIAAYRYIVIGFHRENVMANYRRIHPS